MKLFYNIEQDQTVNLSRSRAQESRQLRWGIEDVCLAIIYVERFQFEPRNNHELGYTPSSCILIWDEYI